MLKYDLFNRKYSSNARMRPSSQQNGTQRKMAAEYDVQIRNRVRPSSVTIEDPCYSTFVRLLFKEAKTCHGANPRPCGDIFRLDTHLKSVEHGNKYANSCKVCDNPAYSKFGVCGVHLRVLKNRWQAADENCFYYYP